MRKLTTKERKQCIHLLQAARIRITLHKNDKICFALITANLDCHGMSEMCKYLTDWVMKSLDGCGLYSAWIRENYWSLYASIEEQEHHLRQGRIAWLDWMINELEHGR